MDQTVFQGVCVGDNFFRKYIHFSRQFCHQQIWDLETEIFCPKLEILFSIDMLNKLVLLFNR